MSYTNASSYQNQLSTYTVAMKKGLGEVEKHTFTSGEVVKF